MAAPKATGAMLDILGLLLQAWEQQTEVHGWQIIRSVHRSGPTVYGVLDRLEDAGWISGSWEQPSVENAGRPRRRYYRLTPSGAEAARQRGVVPARPSTPRPRLAPGFGFRAHPRPAG